MTTTIVWFKDPKILFDKKYISELWPKKGFTPEQKFNAIMRLILLLTILGFLLTNNYKIIVLGVLAILIFSAFFVLQQNKNQDNPYSKIKTKEGFMSAAAYEKNKDQFTNPTQNNPVMNVLLPQISEDPKRKPAAPAYNPAVEKQINQSTIDFVDETLGGNDVDKKLFASLGDSFNFEVGAMNRFYATPSTTIPNDQGGFAEFCYGNMTSCKEGNPLTCTNNPPRIGSVYN
jgi:hypothetical protein